jgi:RND family efflux transporter MFP subunit
MLKRKLLRMLLIVPPVALGVGVFALVVGNKTPLPQAAVSEMSRKVRVIEVPRLTVVPTVVGHGSVQPERRWNAVAEVAGRVVDFNPRLLDGAIIAAETELLRIDPTSYELALAELQAQLSELAIREQNNRSAIAIEMRNRELAEEELTRLTRLRAQGTIAQRDLDFAEQAKLNAAQAVQNLASALALIPAERQVVEARMAQSRLDLANTVIRAPLNMRITDLNVERTQYVSRGENLFVGESIERVEIPVQLSLGGVRPLFAGHADSVITPGDLARSIAIEPTVRLRTGRETPEWEAVFERISGIDPTTRTVGLVVSVDKPFQDATPGERPPIVAGMFVEVELRGKPLPEQVIVPRSSIRNGQVLLVDTEQRLRRAPVTVAFNQGDLSVIEAGLEGGEILVLSDLIPALEGTLLDPVTDTDASRRLRQGASGAGDRE